MNSYIVGLLATDGYTEEYISKKTGEITYNCSIELKDNDVLEKIASEYDIPIHYRERVIKNKNREFYSIYFKTSQVREIGRYLVNSKQDLYAYYINAKDKNAFIRGVFDGDGSVCYYSGRKTLRIGFTINSDHVSILKILKDYFEANDITYSVYLDKRGNKSYNLSIGSKESVSKLFNLMYSDKSNLWLERKYKIFINNGFPKPETV